MKVQVLVRLKGEVLDVQGKAVERGVQNLGFKGCSDVRVGRVIEFDLEASSEAEARKECQAICERVLANPVIEDFEIALLGNQ